MKKNILVRGVLLALALTLTIQPDAVAGFTNWFSTKTVTKHPVIAGLVGIGAVVAVTFLVKWYRAEKKVVGTENEDTPIMSENDEKEIKKHENEIDFENIEKKEVVAVETKKEGSGFLSGLSDWFKSWFTKKEVAKEKITTNAKIEKDVNEKIAEIKKDDLENKNENLNKFNPTLSSLPRRKK